MKHNTYRKAVEHLEFSDDLLENVMKKADRPRSGFRVIRSVVLAAAIIALMATTAVAVRSDYWGKIVEVSEVGTLADDLTDAEVMEFTASNVLDGVTVHYLELKPKVPYSFVDGMLTSEAEGIQQITGDYRLVPLETTHLEAQLEKNGRVYKVSLDYARNNEGIIDRVLGNVPAENGEIYLVATDGKSNQWPVYLDLATGMLRDGLPGYTDEDFEGRVVYADLFRGGILISTLVQETINAHVETHNNLYWIKPGGGKPHLVELPYPNMTYYIQNDNIYCKTRYSALYAMDENGQFSEISEYRTLDDPTNGLLTVRSKTGELGIVDVISGETYIIDGMDIRNDEIDETKGYNAERYQTDGLISIVQTEWICTVGADSEVRLLKLGVFDPEERELKLLDIENEYDGYCNGWLDENRLAVIFKNGPRQYLCIYEFEN